MLNSQTNFLIEPSQPTQSRIRNYLREDIKVAKILFSCFRKRNKCLFCKNAIANAFLVTFESAIGSSNGKMIDKEYRLFFHKVKHFAADSFSSLFEELYPLELLVVLTGDKERNKIFSFFAQVCFIF